MRARRCIPAGIEQACCLTDMAYTNNVTVLESMQAFRSLQRAGEEVALLISNSRSYGDWKNEGGRSPRRIDLPAKSAWLAQLVERQTTEKFVGFSNNWQDYAGCAQNIFSVEIIGR